jgi:hypothetical protein
MKSEFNQKHIWGNVDSNCKRIILFYDTSVVFITDYVVFTNSIFCIEKDAVNNIIRTDQEVIHYSVAGTLRPIFKHDSSSSY